MSYSVKELFPTTQGEGARAGRLSVFCRFSGCNLWSGLEKDRENAKCYFCDTDFVGTDGVNGDKYKTAKDLANKIKGVWNESFSDSASKPYVVFTGGEPLLQLDEELISEVKKLGFEIAVETNGTILAPSGIDWLTVSPKPNSELIQKSGDELKLVYPHEVEPENVSNLNFTHYYLSPLASNSDEETQTNVEKSLSYCKKNPKWKMTFQYHKMLGIP